MLIISPSDCIRCYFDSDYQTISESGSDELKVFYAETKDLSSRYSDLKNFITDDEHKRADRFLFEEDRETYISSHSMLRLILSEELNTNPSGISIIIGKNKKPGIPGNPVYFNLAHTRDAFALVISKESYAGIDLEKVNLSMDFLSIIKTFFSNREREFILQSESEANNRFFLLWTRKEAFLKALGTGIIDNLTQVEVSEQDNYINKRLFDSFISDSASNEHFIYSKKLQNNYLSVAVPYKTEIRINYLNDESLVSYLG
jgi:4'-phosphopantetheinyl transferase